MTWTNTNVSAANAVFARLWKSMDTDTGVRGQRSGLSAGFQQCSGDVASFLSNRKGREPVHRYQEKENEMGAWDYGVFDDDVAYEALDDLRSAQSITQEMERYFDQTIEAEYVEYDDGQYAVVAAAVLDSALNGTEYRCDDDEYPEWIKTLDAKELSPLREKAVAAVEMVMAEESELRELWFENGELFESWLSEKADICDRLRHG